MKHRVVLGALSAACVGVLLLAGCASQRSASQHRSTPEASAGATHRDGRWVGVRDIEVRVPSGWRFGYDAVRPDCIDPSDPSDPWASDVPDAPYVAVGTPDRAVRAIGCHRERRPGDPDIAFGDLPFSWWQPFVKVERSAGGVGGRTRADGRWSYRGWTLTRGTIAGVQITVLAPPNRPSLGADVLGSARRVRTTSLGCATASPVAGTLFTEPAGAPMPSADSIEANRDL
jgi:hypothetical protein